jgi:Ca2+-binding RTX toxin-like protein
MRRGGVLALAVLLALPATAHGAATVTVDAFGVQYEGDGAVNLPVFTDEPAPVMGDVRVFIEDPNGVTPGMGCVSVSAPTLVRCDVDSSDRVNADLGAGNDVARSETNLVGNFLDGEEDDDRVTGTDAAENPFGSSISENIDGGPGRDELFGRAGHENLDGGEGDGDVVDGGEDDDSLGFSDDDGTGDVLRGGPGFDSVSLFWGGPDPVPGAVVDLAAGSASWPGVSAAALEGIEEVFGYEGPDTLLGNGLINDLSGREGDDTIDGRLGPDDLNGGPGGDTLEGRDGSPDLLDGGLGADTCNADQFDLRANCEGGELVELPPFGTPPDPDRRAPACTARGLPGRIDADRVRSRGLAFRASCDEDGTLAVRLVGTLRRTGRRTRLARAGDLELASTTKRVTAGRRVRLRLRPARRLRRLVRPRGRLRVVLAGTDADGNQGTRTRRVRLR